MKKITGRDIRFFLLGVFAMFTFVIIYDWEHFMDGFKAGMGAAKQNNTERVEASTAPSSEIAE